MTGASPPGDGPAAGPVGTLPGSPAAARNLRPILDMLVPRLPDTGLVLELASGLGEHVAALAERRPDLIFQPSDADPDRLAVIDARCTGLPNVRAARALDACAPGWGGGVRAGLLVVVNLLHLISEAEMAVLLDEAAQAVAPDGLLAIYGPFLRDGTTTSEGDAEFDARLRAEDPALGYKEVEVVETVLGALGLSVERFEMPANNVMLVARKGAVPGL